MKINKLQISRHAAQRMAQRNIDAGDLAVVLRFGHVEHRAGAKFYFLAERDLPVGTERQLSRLVGTTVVVEHDSISTVYRNRRALAKIKRKPKIVRRGSFDKAFPMQHAQTP